MDDFEGSYAPQSPDLSGLNHFDEPDQPAFAPQSYYPPNHVPYQTAYNQTPLQQDSYDFNQPSLPTSHQYSPLPISHDSDQKFRGGESEFGAEQGSAKPGRKMKKSKAEEDVCDKPAPGIEEGIEVKTKFPVARIKRIMQADEDVGKVAQVTPTAVSKALELFMISIVTKAATVAEAKQSKRVTAAHLKQALQNDEQFDFLADIISKVPDAPAPKKREETEDSDEAVDNARRKKRAPRKKKKDGDDD